jgi:hypothetical protein
MEEQSLIWDVNEIFEIGDRYQEHCGDGVEYSDCKLLVNLGTLEKGEICDVEISSSTHGDFSMYVNCKSGKSATFVPVWTQINGF